MGAKFAIDPTAGSTMSDPVLVVEGMSDTAAGMDLNFTVVGRSTAKPGKAEIAWLRELLGGRHVVIVAEHDCSGVGMTGAAAVADMLHGKAASVKLVEPPEDVKDLRTWIVGHNADRAELNAAIHGARAYTPAVGKNKKAGRSEPNLICMADVEPAEVSWLWPGRIPLGRMSLLAGRQGLGKSFLTSYMASNVSRGRNWMDGTPCPAGAVVLCSAEDDPADTIAPRLIAHDADRSKVHLLAGVKSSNGHGRDAERVFTLADLPALRATLERLGDVRLIVVDPIGSYLGGQADAHRDNEVRGVLAPVCQLAVEHNAALLVVAHNRKSAAPTADDTVMGSRAFTALARSVLHLLSDPDDETECRRLLLPGKNNLAEPPAGLAFDIHGGQVLDPAGVGRPCIHWHDGTVDITADEAVNREPIKTDKSAPERDEAEAWLKQKLASGPCKSKDIIEQAKETKGIAEKTLRRAMKSIGCDAYRPDNPGPWFWRLSGAEAAVANPRGERDHLPPAPVKRGHVGICPSDSAKSVISEDPGRVQPHGHMATSWKVNSGTADLSDAEEPAA